MHSCPRGLNLGVKGQPSARRLITGKTAAHRAFAQTEAEAHSKVQIKRPKPRLKAELEDSTETTRCNTGGSAE
ncbi:hypothetical protein PT2222_20394 [Paraburkholderia tropica]